MSRQKPIEAPPTSRFSLMLHSGKGTRIIMIGDRTMVMLLVVAGLALAWYLFATLFLILRDDIVVSLISGKNRQHYAYEDRIVELRARIDKITTRQIANQETIEDRVSGLVARQAELEARQVMVADIGTRAAGLGITALPAREAQESLQNPDAALAFSKNTAGGIGGPAAPVKGKPTPLDSAMPDNTFQSRTMPLEPIKGFDTLKMRGSLQSIVKEVERRSEVMERSQLETLRSIAQNAYGTVVMGQQVVAATGLNAGRFGQLALPSAEVKPTKMVTPVESFMLRNVETPTSPGGVGGPLLPVRASDAFETNLSLAETALRNADNAKSILGAIPLARPLGAVHDITSTFGTRYDPFTRGLAMHSGLDFRAATGTPVRATAGGKVVTAEVTGGYGRMVEIDHGFGISTRYGHLSAILVREGDVVPKGAVIGQVGSTGRSTGPHLHYEVRLDDDATDPQRFLRAANAIGVTN